MSTPGSLLISCSVLQADIELLRRAGRMDCPVEFVESMLHMHPERRSRVLDASLSAARERGQTVVLAYGDCCAEMTDFSMRPGVARTPCQCCCDLLLGRAEFRPQLR